MGGTGTMADHGMPSLEAAHEHDHPGENVYIRVAIVLTIITAIEVIIYYIEGIRGFLVPALIVLSLAKFVAVVGYFMHLKFDDKRFAWIFASGMAISVSVFIAMGIMMATDEYYLGDVPAVVEE
jgi:cytochrome c oxidase subunit IV